MSEPSSVPQHRAVMVYLVSWKDTWPVPDTPVQNTKHWPVGTSLRHQLASPSLWTSATVFTSRALTLSRARAVCTTGCRWWVLHWTQQKWWNNFNKKENVYHTSHYLYLQVFIPDREPFKLCGDQSPGLMVTNSSRVTLDYHTDSDGWSRGWSLAYSTHSERQTLTM